MSMSVPKLPWYIKLAIGAWLSKEIVRLSAKYTDVNVYRQKIKEQVQSVKWLGGTFRGWICDYIDNMPGITIDGLLTNFAKSLGFDLSEMPV